MKRLAFVLTAAGLALAGCGDKKKDPVAGAGSTAPAAGDPAAPAEARPAAKAPIEAPRKLLAVGAQVPAFTMQAHTGETIDPAALRGQKLVLYFYPKDETPG
jgi:hypothetical protein